MDDSIKQKYQAVTFEEAWKRKEREGFHYGEDALVNVRFGWQLAQENAGLPVGYVQSTQCPYIAITDQLCNKCGKVHGYSHPSVGTSSLQLQHEKLLLLRAALEHIERGKLMSAYQLRGYAGKALKDAGYA